MRRNLLLTALLSGLTLAAPLAALTTAAPAAAQTRAERDASAEAYVLTEANRALHILGDKSLSIEGKKTAFRAFVDEVADVPTITGYVLGKYRRQLSDAQYKDFAVTFREYANTVYETRLNTYKGETLRVTGSTVRRPGDVIVTSEVVGGQTRQPIKVLWRILRNGTGQWHVVDVQVEGIWLAVTQQQDFVSTLDNNRGDISVLIGQLKGQKKEALKPHK
jgi:phospholipid transport system substrate-binding protein